MSRTLSSGMQSHLAGREHTRCSMLRIDLKDGTRFALTDHDFAISYDLSDGVGAVSYSPAAGVIPSDLDLSEGFEADDFEIEGPINEAGIANRIALLGGRFEDATVYLFQINHQAPADGVIAFSKGYVVDASIKGGRYAITIHTEISRFGQKVGRMISNVCDADFGDARCTRTPVTVVGTVTSVTSSAEFGVSYSGTYADTFFRRGTVEFLTGDLAGTTKQEILEWTEAGAIELWDRLAAVPEIGDTLTITQGCYDPASGEAKTRNACVALGGDAEPFRGFADVPGNKAFRYPNPASS